MNKSVLLGCGALAALVSQPARAEYIQTMGVDESCAAVGGACVAREGDLGAYYVNPATATDFERPRIGVNMRILDTRSLDLIDSGGNHDIPRTNTKSGVAFAPTVGAYFPVSKNVTLGLGIGAPFAITGDWTNDDGIHRYNMSDQALFILDVSPTIAVKISDKLSIGASVSITAFKHLRTQTLIPDSFGAALPPALGGAGTIIPTTPTSPIIGSITLNTNRDFGIGLPPDNMQAEFGEAALVLGARYKLNPLITLGIAGRTRTKTTFKGTTTLALGAATETVPFRLRLDMPGHIQAGMALHLPFAELSFDYQRTFWSDAVGLGTPANIEFGTPLLGFINRLQVNYKAHDSDTYRFGVSHNVNPGIRLMAGYARDMRIFGAETVDVLTYDSNRNIFSLGARMDTRGGDETKKGWILAASFQLTSYDRRTIATGVSQNLGGVSLPNLTAADTLSFTSNRSPFTFDGNIRALSFSVQRVF